ncbi:MAG: hypothetical protein ACI9J2_001645 [Saprospiraceae bacterium]|jgi:uncharacterized protein (TIRG00374 family)
MKNLLLVIAKVFISVGLITWLLSGADLEQIWHTIKTANVLLLVIAFLTFFLGYFITAKRWQSLLAALEVPVSIKALLQSFSISIFFNNFLPSTIGGDAYRMYDSYRLGAGKARAIAVVFIDRVIGLSALLLLCLVVSLFASEVAEKIPFLQLLLSAVMIGMAVLTWIVFGSGGEILLKLTDRPNSLFRLAHKTLDKVYDGFSLFKGRRDVLIKAVGLSLLLQANVVIHCILIAKALSIDIPTLAMFIIIPLSYLIMVLPISINGVGLRESVFVFFFGLFSVPSEQALAFAFISFGMILAQGVIGGIVFLFRRRHDKDGGLKSF